MNVLVLDDYVPRVLVDQLREIPHGPRETSDFTDRTRAEVPQGSPLFEELFGLVFCQDLVERAEQFDDLAWRLYWSGAIAGWQAFVSRYTPGGIGYTWHVDQGIDRRALNWILNLDEPRGGALEISGQAFSFERPDAPNMRAAIRLAPKVGRLVMFPACYPHRVMPAAGVRTTCHGHLTM